MYKRQVYKRHLETRGRLQTVLVGYADSAQEAGMIAARLAAYRAQRNLSEALRRGNEEHVLFYSRGGSIPRGGGRIDRVLRAAPAESVSGVLRFTEQGESISQSYGPVSYTHLIYGLPAALERAEAVLLTG